MTPTLIGYFPKCTVQRPDWLKAAGVEEICSVSTCIAEAPNGWIDQWRHNEMWVYDTPELAWSVVPDAARADFHVYGHRLFPVQFDEGQQRPFEIPKVDAALLPVSFERLGLDMVSRSCGTSYECSPLSCNHMAEHVAANRYCLVDDVDVAFRLAAEFEASGCEPGPYHVIEVWRKRLDAP